ncbi:MAG: relaxase/mobilization nuclease domain-containing protein [Bryobacteraceae bacterium]
MIINGGSRSNARFFAKHLTHAGENERVTLREIRNLAAETVHDAFREMEAIALGTQCKNYFYHANINPLSTELLTPEQWDQASDTLEENLGLKGHARFIVEHQKKGRVHRHVIWLRIDVNRMVAVEMTDDYEKHQATARQLERKFRLTRGHSVLGLKQAAGARPGRRPKSWETFRGHTSGIDPRVMTEQVTSLFRGSADGSEFASRLMELGFQLARGDRRDFCIVDAAGHVHSLGRRLSGIPAAELKEFVLAINRDAVPDLAQVRKDRSRTSSASGQ